MVFASFSFISFFLPITLVAYYIINNRVWRNVILLFVSLLFYAWGEPVYVVLMVIYIFFNWGLALQIFKYKRSALFLLTVGIAINLSGIILFKYASFFVGTLNVVFHTKFIIPDISLPIGISFYTFQAISYLLDVYRGVVAPQSNPIFFGTYLSMFPQLIAGPIVRYKTVQKEILFRIETLSDFSKGLRRFVVGLAKKVLIANTMGKVADTILVLEPSTIGLSIAWFAFIAYAFQIYFDFSGYSDMAIGLGMMFGFHFNENFNYPYIAKSITEFWRRWHISLSSFFRDYIYIPLGGNRVDRLRLIINIFIVWALTGLWHGASWNFVCWGIYYGLLLMGEKFFWGQYIKKLPAMFQHFYVIFIFITAWVIFRIENFSQTITWFGALFGQNGWGNIATLNALNVLHYYPWIIIAIIGSTPLVRNIHRWLNNKPRICWFSDVYIFFIFCWSMIKLGMGGFNPFIYFRF